MTEHFAGSFTRYIGVRVMKLKSENMDCGMNYAEMHGDMLKEKRHAHAHVLQ